MNMKIHIQTHTSQFTGAKESEKIKWMTERKRRNSGDTNFHHISFNFWHVYELYSLLHLPWLSLAYSRRQRYIIFRLCDCRLIWKKMVRNKRGDRQKRQNAWWNSSNSYAQVNLFELLALSSALSKLLYSSAQNLDEGK